MGKSGQNRGQYCRKPGNIAEARAEKIVEFLKSLYPDKTAERVAGDGIASVDTVRNWLDRTCAPSLLGYSRMISVYGVAFLIATMDQPHDWMLRAAQQELRESLEARRAEVERQISELMA